MAASMRQSFEHAEDERLAPFGLRSANAARRHPIEDEGREFDYRTRFQRDRDRIVYSRSFRRLRQKAQTGILPEYEDHRRNRLTHTLEVAQLARTLARALRLNEDLVEAIALGHDLGQPPFGPTGERALDDLLCGRLDGRGGPGLGDLAGFWFSWQGLRVVDRLEKRYEHHGLNLTDPVREGILKAGAGDRVPPDDLPGVRSGLAPSFECQAVILADRIGTALHDLDDALQAGVVEVARVEKLPLVRELRRKLGKGYRVRAGKFMKANAIHRGLTHLLVTGSVLASERTLRRWVKRHEIDDVEAFEAARDAAVRGDELGLAPKTTKLLQDLEGFLDTHVSRGAVADRVDARGRRVLIGLFAAFHADPSLLEDHVLLRFKQIAGIRFLRDLRRDAVDSEIDRRYRRDPRFLRVLADYLAGMTDAYAIAEHRRLSEMGAVPIPSAEQLRRERAP